jgi:deazaflavin-dependent oxidoreductase (nitroreductase family)
MTVSQQDLIAGMGSAGTFDITTIGRKTGQPRRLEIAYHVIDGRLYVSGIPRPQRRSWLANLDANSSLTVHLRKPVRADVAAIARVINGEAERRAILELVARNWRRNDVDLMVQQSPLVEVTLEPQAGARA